ncbi:hypothetical protein AAU61_07015 [Desulfocarbo indianensis]|nr:hypothetical protein AAU61_07015 [Desulfocarbo indianensis]
MAPSDSTGQGTEQRREERLAVSSFTLPFLGTRVADHQTFQYVLIDTSSRGAGIALPRWALARESLNNGDLVNLHLPFHLHGETFDAGPVAWTRWSDDLDAQICGVRLENPVPSYYPVLLDLEGGGVEVDLAEFSGQAGLLAMVIKDAFLLKKGVHIYLRHLVPYFSRVGGFNQEEYKALKSMLLDDIVSRVSQHEKELGDLRKLVAGLGDSEVAAGLDLEHLRELVESELYLELFRIAFESDVVNQYLEAIKTLEGRLYYNYNTCVMLYLRSLEET